MSQTFTLLPLTMDPSTKALTSPQPDLTPHLTHLTTLQRSLVPLPSQTPPPPLPTNPKRTAQMQKMREQGSTALRRSTNTPSNATSSAQEAIKLFTYALEMALGRPGWEPSSLVREEASALFSQRAQAYIQAGMWPEGAADASCAVELNRRVGGNNNSNGNNTGGGGNEKKAYAQRGRCLVEMGRWEEAREWVREGLEVAGGGGGGGGAGDEKKGAGNSNNNSGDAELGGLGREIERHFTEKEGK